MPCSWRHFPSLYEASFYVYAYDGAPLHGRKIRLVEFLTFAYNCRPSHLRRSCQSWKGLASVMHGTASFFKLSISNYTALLLFVLREAWLPTREWLLLVCVVARYPFDLFHAQD